MFKNPIVWCLLAACSALAEDTSAKPEFSAPERLKAAGEIIRTEDPGYACPCWADMDGDGKKDLVVGQFAAGKMKVYRNLGEGKLAEGKWLEADGKTAEVPGVW
jgi:hypothetical protein